MSDAIREALDALMDLRNGARAEYHADQHSVDADYRTVKAALQSSQTAPAVPEGLIDMLKACQSWIGGSRESVEDDEGDLFRWDRLQHFIDMLDAAPQPDHSPDVGKVVQGEPVPEKVEWIKGFPPCDGDGGICHIPLKGHPDFMAIAFNNEGSLVDGCGDDIGCELDDVERWRPLNASVIALTHQVTGARDMLREAAKQFRANNDIGHAAMCENHADEIDRLRASQQEGGE